MIFKEDMPPEDQDFFKKVLAETAARFDLQGNDADAGILFEVTGYKTEAFGWEFWDDFQGFEAEEDDNDDEADNPPRAGDRD